jgi:class 3 adenylate cyclase
MAKHWNRDRAAEQIEKRLDEVEAVTVVDFKRDMSLENIPTNKAYRMDAAHLYADILNLADILCVTEEEGVTCHRRTLRFLNLHYRAVNRILSECDARRVDFHNQRLHAVVSKPYDTEDGAERTRLERAVAIGQMIIDVLKQTRDDDDQIPNAKMRIGIDTGLALAVNNGRRGGREPLFLGEPANRAAKLSAAGPKQGIYLTNKARKTVGLEEVDQPAAVALTDDEIAKCKSAAALPVTVDEIVRGWRCDLIANPISAFEFSRHTPPLRTLDIAALTPGNSRRQEAVSLYADIDNFTDYVAAYVDHNPEDVVRVFHVLRSEMDRVLTVEFDGRRVRFIGDCIHGLVCEGTSSKTDEEASVSLATLCSGALRSSFRLALDKLKDRGIDIADLALAIGFELGPMTVTRLGLKGDRVRCSVSRGVLASEVEQQRCDGTETAIGILAYAAGTGGVKNLFGKTRKASDLDYNEVVEALSEDGDATAKGAQEAAYLAAAPAIVEAARLIVRPHAC